MLQHHGLLFGVKRLIVLLLRVAATKKYIHCHNTVRVPRSFENPINVR